ncbi:MAG TPA: aryl-sulfate sulfotransferase [Vicinamibacterales bacterium]|nr:aryl-sulfate sulfotransferase [Vicinamibacterales bacterium]
MRSPLALTPAALILASALAVSGQSVYPTGTTIYEPARAWSGFTVLSPLNTPSAIVIDMNGTVVKQWEGYNNSAGGPARVLPGGDVIAAAGARPGRQESVELVQRDFEGNIIWRFDRNEQIQSNDGQMIWSARQHHDWQREDFPAGYYSPDARPARSGSNTLLLTHTDHRQPDVADVLLQDDRLIEVSPKGEIVWQWIAGEHLGELGFSESARAAIRGAGRGGAPRGDGARGDGPRGNGARGDGAGPGGGRGAGPGRGGAGFDWLHVNSATYVGPNRWFDAGDRRFAPNNVIISSRQANVLAIVARDGKVVWRLGPDFLESEATRAIGQIIGQHHAHFIPKGLPGAGNLLVFDNGGASGYGPPSGIAPNGTGVYARSNSRVLEIDPVALKLVWSYTAPGRFFSTNISGAQRLPNGNTLVTAGAGGRLFEVTTDGRIVWEYLNPLFAGAQGSNAVYRSYRVPYEWIPQLPRPAEKAVTPPALGDFRVP